MCVHSTSFEWSHWSAYKRIDFGYELEKLVVILREISLECNNDKTFQQHIDQLCNISFECNLALSATALSAKLAWCETLVKIAHPKIENNKIKLSLREKKWLKACRGGQPCLTMSEVVTILWLQRAVLNDTGKILRNLSNIPVLCFCVWIGNGTFKELIIKGYYEFIMHNHYFSPNSGNKGERMKRQKLTSWQDGQWCGGR